MQAETTQMNEQAAEWRKKKNETKPMKFQQNKNKQVYSVQFR